jgi:hypothetical protein
MSTKIYTAYRTREGVDIWDIVPRLLAKSREAVLDVLHSLIVQLQDTAQNDATGEMKKEIFAAAKRRNPDEPLTDSIVFDFLYMKYREQHTSALRNAFDFNASIVIRRHEGRYYLIPYSDMHFREVFDFLAEDPDLEDFSCWNNTDPPEEFRRDGGYEQWNARGAVWDTLHERGDEYLVLDVVTSDSFYMLSVPLAKKGRSPHE